LFLSCVLHWNFLEIQYIEPMYERNINNGKEFIRKLGLSVRKLEGRSFDIFSRLKDFVEENSVETIDTGFYQCIKNHLVNLQSRFSISRRVNDKYKWVSLKILIQMFFLIF
jgi:hypothetical protein